MLVEVKAKVKHIIDGKTKGKTETYLKDNCDLFVEAEQIVMQFLTREIEDGTVESFEIQSLKISPIKEVYTDSDGEETFIVTFKDTFTDDKGNEKPIKYTMLIWADSLSQANKKIQEIVRQGYDMKVEGIKQVEYYYIP